MKEITEDELKKLAKYPYTISQFLYAYKTSGLWYAIKLIFNIVKLSVFTWSYKHIKFVRNKVNKRLDKTSPYLKIMFEMFTMQDFDFENAVQSLPENERNELLKKIKNEQNKEYTV